MNALKRRSLLWLISALKTLQCQWQGSPLLHFHRGRPVAVEMTMVTDITAMSKHLWKIWLNQSTSCSLKGGEGGSQNLQEKLDTITFLIINVLQ